MFDFLLGRKKRSSRRKIPIHPEPAFDPRVRVTAAPIQPLYPATIPPPNSLSVAGKYWSLDAEGRVGLIFGQPDSLRDIAPIMFSIENELGELRLYGVLALIIEPEVAFALVRRGVISSRDFIMSSEQYGRIAMNDVLVADQRIRIEIALETSYPDFEFRVASHPEHPSAIRGTSFEAGSITDDF